MLIKLDESFKKNQLQTINASWKTIILVPENGLFVENPIKMDDLGGNTPHFGNTHFSMQG